MFLSSFFFLNRLISSTVSLGRTYYEAGHGRKSLFNGIWSIKAFTPDKAESVKSPSFFLFYFTLNDVLFSATVCRRNRLGIYEAHAKATEKQLFFIPK